MYGRVDTRALAFRLGGLLLVALTVIALGVASVPQEAHATEATASECYPPGPECDSETPTTDVDCDMVGFGGSSIDCAPEPECTDCMPDTGVEAKSLLMVGLGLAASGLLALTVVRGSASRRKG